MSHDILPYSLVVKAFKRVYEGPHTGKEAIEYNLICRYEDKISPRLRERKKVLLELGKKQMQELTYRRNPFLNLINKDDGFIKTYWTIPVIGDDSDIK